MFPHIYQITDEHIPCFFRNLSLLIGRVQQLHDTIYDRNCHFFEFGRQHARLRRERRQLIQRFRDQFVHLGIGIPSVRKPPVKQSSKTRSRGDHGERGGSGGIVSCGVPCPDRQGMSAKRNGGKGEGVRKRKRRG